MSATGSGYDLSVTTFSPDGRVFQVEYAGKAVEKSGTAIGIRCNDGVVLGVEKVIISKMLMPGANRRIYTIDTHVGIAVSGIAGDAKQLVNRARSEAREYRMTYGSPIPGSVLAERVAGFVHTYTLYWYLRPFGCSIIVASVDEDAGPQLYQIEPSGELMRYFATATGKSKSGAKTELERIKFDRLSAREAVNQIATIIYKLHDDIKDKDFELELSWCCAESKMQHVMVPASVRNEAVRLAKETKQKADMDDSDDDDDGGSKGKKAAPSAATAASTATAASAGAGSSS